MSFLKKYIFASSWTSLISKFTCLNQYVCKIISDSDLLAQMNLQTLGDHGRIFMQINIEVDHLSSSKFSRHTNNMILYKNDML